MSFVGPRPNTPIDVSMYSLKEEELLFIRPGITDFSSIVFADEGDILDSFENPDLATINKTMESKLGLFYIKKSKLTLDLS